MGWSQERRVVVLRREIKADVLLTKKQTKEQKAQQEFAFMETAVPVKKYEYAVLVTSLPDLKSKVADLYKRLDKTRLPEPRTIKIPVVYGGEHGPDLEWVADYHSLSEEEIIGYHTQPTYRVYMIGFTPGYPYLGEVPDNIVTPRRKTPRTRVPKGSVGIAQKQTGIYSVDSPGGWQIIGWTPLTLFEPQRQTPSLLVMGDRVQFYAIPEKEAAQWQV